MNLREWGKAAVLVLIGGMLTIGGIWAWNRVQAVRNEEKLLGVLLQVVQHNLNLGTLKMPPELAPVPPAAPPAGPSIPPPAAIPPGEKKK